MPSLSPREFFGFLFKNEASFKTVNLYANAANGNKQAQALAKDVTVAACKEIASNTAEAGKKAAVITLDAVESTADIVSEVSGDIALVGFATAQPEVAGPFGTISEGADIVSIGSAGLKACISGEEKDKKNFFNKLKNFGISKVFTTSLSKFLQKGSNGSVSEFNADAAAAFVDKVRSSNEETK